MHPKGIGWTLGVLIVLYGGAMMLPAGLAWIDGSGHLLHFVAAGLIVMAVGLALMHWGGGAPDKLSHRDGFLIVALAWVSLSLLGAVPFWTTGTITTITDALFESTSGLTTTGATVLSGLDRLPHSILFWRSLQEWLGGMGIIVLAVAVMPLLGVGGMQLFRAETPGPVKDKLTARVTETAKVLWYLYLAMTMLAGLVYWMLGMSPFDAVNHAMCTVAIGGFSTHDASFGYFDDPALRLACVVFMVLAGINFTLHFSSILRGFSWRVYFGDEEFRVYIGWLVVLILLVALLAEWEKGAGFVEVVFNVVSVATTTGFAVSDYSQWPPGTTLLLLVAMFVGACAGSTGGGMKVVRILLLFRQGMREILRLVHPHGVVHVKLGGQRVSPVVGDALWGFAVLFLVCYLVIATIVAFTGVDVVTAFSSAAACITNTGPGFGEVGPVDNYAGLPWPAKIVLMFAMVLGRLEIYTFFVLLVPAFWRR